MIPMIDRSVLRDIRTPLFSGTVIIAFLFGGNEMVALLLREDLTKVDIPTVFQLLLLRMPYLLALTLPAGMAIGASLAITRLSRDNEVTAMRAAGIPIRRIMLPVLGVGLALSGVSYWLTEHVVPPSMNRHAKLMMEVARVSALPTFRQNVVTEFGDYFGRFGTVSKRADGGVDLTDVFIFESLRPGEILLYRAPSAVYMNGIWTLNAPVMNQISDKDMVLISSPEKVVIDEAISVENLLNAELPENDTAQMLLERIKAAKAAGRSALPLELAYHSRFSGPASCAILAVLAFLLTLRAAKGETFLGLMISVGFALLHLYGQLIAIQVLGPREILPPMLAIWSPNILYLAAALYLLWRLE
jgi:lipopolysaccharide export system permease protein